jgi:hypothetical protein
MDALNSRTSSNTSDATKRSSLSTGLYILFARSLKFRNVTTLLGALVAFIRQIELSSISEIHTEYMSFLKDSLSNPIHFKNLYGAILRLSTVYGEKLDDTVILDKKKMRRDFGVLLVSTLTYC